MATEVHTHAKIMLSTGAERRPAVNISGVWGTACRQEAWGCAGNAELKAGIGGGGGRQIINYSAPPDKDNHLVSAGQAEKNILPRGQHGI